jgi:hypothetical protein
VLPPSFIRDPAFRRVVIEVYDYRCAATGLRLVLPDGTAMVEAAHIDPFSQAQDDDPRNGLALTPNMHWAMDEFLISPGPDFKRHVARQLDRRIRDFEVLVDLEGEDLLLPAQARLYPKREALQWRVARLGTRGWARARSELRLAVPSSVVGPANCLLLGVPPRLCIGAVWLAVDWKHRWSNPGYAALVEDLRDEQVSINELYPQGEPHASIVETAALGELGFRRRLRAGDAAVPGFHQRLPAR